MKHLILLKELLTSAINLISINLGLLIRVIQKNAVLEYLRNMEGKPIDMFACPSIIKNINNANYKGYVHVKFKTKFENEDSCHAEAIFDSFDLKG